MKSNVYLMLEDFFENDIIDIAKELGYSEENIIILESDEKRLISEYPEVYSNLRSCYHNRDGRTIMEYAQDLVCSWIFEDYLMHNLKLLGAEIELSGADNERKILKSNKISNSSDYIIRFRNKSAYIELANDYKGYWKKYNKCDLRDDKFKHLKDMGNNHDLSLLLGIDFKNMEFFLIDVNDEELDIKYSQYHYVYKKPVYTIMLNSVVYHNFEFQTIINEIMNLIDNGEN